MGVLAFAFIACGSDDAEEGDPQEGQPLPVPGTCRALCCSAADCASGESCEPFDAVLGTLGACSGTGASQWSSPAELPANCWTANQPLCTVATSAECEDTDVCAFVPSTDPEIESVVACAGGERTKTEGEACDLALGPWCGAKLHCVPD
jgi:hypothetical protein